MTKQPEDWLDDVPGDDIEDEDDESIWVSKSEIKRDAEELKRLGAEIVDLGKNALDKLKRLGAEIVDLGKNALDKIPLDADLRAAIELAPRIKMEGRRRQLQLIGKMLRQRDVEPIRQALDKLKNRHNQQVVLFHKLDDLGKNALDKIPLDADLRAAIELAQRIKMEGRRRQLQLIGKMLRQRDVEPIRQALDKLKNRHNQQVVLFHKLENLRDRLIDQGDDAIAEVLNLWPDADRQQLRTLIRNAKKEKEGNKPPKSARQIFQYLRELAENEG